MASRYLFQNISYQHQCGWRWDLVYLFRTRCFHPTQRAFAFLEPASLLWHGWFACNNIWMKLICNARLHVYLTFYMVGSGCKNLLWLTYHLWTMCQIVSTCHVRVMISLQNTTELRSFGLFGSKFTRSPATWLVRISWIICCFSGVSYIYLVSFIFRMSTKLGTTTLSFMELSSVIRMYVLLQLPHKLRVFLKGTWNKG